MGIYENIQRAAKSRGYTVSAIESALSLPRSSIAKYNAHVPSVDKIKQIASFLNVSIDSLMDDSETYYTNPDTAKMAQQLFDNPDLRVLFDAAKDAKPEDLKLAADMLKRFKESNPDG